MKVRILTTLAAILFVAGTLNAQTYAIGQSSDCSPGSAIACSAPLFLADADPASFRLADDQDSWPYRHSIVFSSGLAGLGTATVNQDASFQTATAWVTATKGTVTKTEKVVTSVSLTYYGTDTSGNAYQGAMTISFDYHYIWSCSGKACHTGFQRSVTGGSTTFAIATY